MVSAFIFYHNFPQKSLKRLFIQFYFSTVCLCILLSSFVLAVEEKTVILQRCGFKLVKGKKSCKILQNTFANTC